MPARCELELSSACNLRCTYCPRRFLEPGSRFIDFGLFCKIIDELAPDPNTILTLHRRGESLLHPQFSDCLEYVRGKFTTVQLATNGTLLNDAVSELMIKSLSFVSFSLDAPEAYDRTRPPARYQDVERKIRRFLQLNRGRVLTQASMVRTPETPDTDVALFRSIWADRVDRIRIYEEHSADGQFGSLTSSRSQRVACAMPFYEMLIFSDGKVGRCNHDWNGAPLGDANTSSIRQIWHSRSYHELRCQHMTQHVTDGVCSRCDSWYPVPGSQMTGETYES
ncbi:MAG: radical SAM protein [Pseudomonadota bacterium]